MDEVITWEEAAASGISEHEMRVLVAKGDWTRLLRGWYATRRAVDDEDLHRLRLCAWRRVYDRRAVVSHVSAAVLLDLPLHDLTLSTVHLARLGEGRSKLAAGFHLHAAPKRALDPVSGVEHPALAVLQLAVHSFPGALVAADAALGRSLTSGAELVEVVDELGPCRGSSAMRRVAERADGRHESPGETLTALELDKAGISVTPQFQVPGTERWTASGAGYRADFRVDDERVLIEFDGKAKYGGDPDALWREKQREDRMRGLGWWFVRPIWTDLHRAGGVAGMVRAAVSASRAGYRDLPAS